MAKETGEIGEYVKLSLSVHNFPITHSHVQNEIYLEFISSSLKKNCKSKK